MHGERFESPEAAIETFRTLISEVTALEWKKCFENWYERTNSKNVSISKANTSKNNKTIYRILHVFFHIICRNFSSSLRMYETC